LHRNNAGFQLGRRHEDPLRSSVQIRRRSPRPAPRTPHSRRPPTPTPTPLLACYRRHPPLPARRHGWPVAVVCASCIADLRPARYSLNSVSGRLRGAYA
jgi:hypothetical protein